MPYRFCCSNLCSTLCSSSSFRGTPSLGTLSPHKADLSGGRLEKPTYRAVVWPDGRSGALHHGNCRNYDKDYRYPLETLNLSYLT